MRTTLTLVGDRVADAGFFLSFGEGNHKTNNAIHLVVDWDPNHSPDPKHSFYTTAEIALVDKAGLFVKNLTASQLMAVEKFCHQYANFYAKDLEALNAPP